MVIRQGDVFRIELGEPTGSEPAYRHLVVVIQNNIFNRSRLRTTVVCALTSNLKRARDTGNVLLDPEEAHLPKQSVVVVSQVITVDESALEEYIGALSYVRVRQIFDGLTLVMEPRDIE